MTSLPSCLHQDQDVAALRERLLREGEISASQQEILANLPGWESDDQEETTTRRDQPAAPEAAEQPAINPWASWTVSRSNAKAQGGFPMHGNPPVLLPIAVQRGSEEHQAAKPRDVDLENAEARDQHLVGHEPYPQASPLAEPAEDTSENHPSTQPRFLSRLSAGVSRLLGMSGRKSHDSVQVRQYQTQAETPTHDMSPAFEDFFQTPESQPSRFTTGVQDDDEATRDDDGADTRHKASPLGPARDTQDTQVLSESQIAGSSKAGGADQTALSNYSDAPVAVVAQGAQSKLYAPHQRTKPASIPKQTKSTASQGAVAVSHQPTASTQSAPAATATTKLEGADKQTSSSSPDNVHHLQQQQQTRSQPAAWRPSPPVGIGSKVLEAALLSAGAAASAAEAAAAAPSTSTASAPAREHAASTMVKTTTVTVRTPDSKTIPETKSASDQPRAISTPTESAQTTRSEGKVDRSTKEVVTILQVLAPCSPTEMAPQLQKPVPAATEQATAERAKSASSQPRVRPPTDSTENTQSQGMTVQSMKEVGTISQVLAPSSPNQMAQQCQSQGPAADQQHAEPALVQITTSSRPSPPSKAASDSAQVEGSTRKRPMERTMLEAMKAVLKLKPPKAQADPYRWLEVTGLTRYSKFQRV